MNSSNQTGASRVGNDPIQVKLQGCLERVGTHRDKQAFAEVFEYFAPLLRSYSLAREPGAALMADELAQTVLIKVWEKANTYCPSKASVKTWVYTLARNSRIDILRRNGRYVTEIDPEYIWDEQEDESSDPFLEIQQRRAESTIGKALEQLSPDQKQVLEKVYLEGKTHQESSEELNLPLGTVKSRVRLALKKLQVILDR